MDHATGYGSAMWRKVQLLGGFLWVGSCTGADPSPSSTSDAIDTASALDGPCEGTVTRLFGDIEELSLGPHPCGHVALTDVEPVPVGPTLEIFVNSGGTQILPLVSVADATLVEGVTWSGTFDLPGVEAMVAVAWPKEIGAASFAGPLGVDPVSSSGGLLIGRPDGGWLIVGAVGQLRNDLTVQVTWPDQIRIDWGGDPLAMTDARPALFDPVTLALGADPVALLAHWRDEVVGRLTPNPARIPSMWGPVDQTSTLAAIGILDPDVRLGAVITPEVRELRDQVRDLGRAWVAAVDPFTVDPNDPAGLPLVSNGGAPVLVDGRAVIDPTAPEGFEHIRLTAERVANRGADGVFIPSAVTLAVTGERRGSDQSGVAAYRLGLEAVRAGLGDVRAIVLEGAIPLASIGVADAVAWPRDTDPAQRVASAGAFGFAASAWWRLGPVELRIGDDARFAFDAATGLVAGGTVRLPGIPTSETQRTWLFGEQGLGPLADAAGTASPPDPLWEVRGPRFVGPAGVVALVNGRPLPVRAPGPGGSRWPDGVAGTAGPFRNLDPFRAEIWIPEAP